jgi:hypothetical protein
MPGFIGLFGTERVRAPCLCLPKTPLFAGKSGAKYGAFDYSLFAAFTMRAALRSGSRAYGATPKLARIA